MHRRFKGNFTTMCAPFGFRNIQIFRCSETRAMGRSAKNWAWTDKYREKEYVQHFFQSAPDIPLIEQALNRYFQ